MIAVSDAWKNVQQRFLLPEAFVEISCTITEVGVQEDAVASGTNEEIFSDVGSVPGTSGEKATHRYATLEPNLWALDGTRDILPVKSPYTNSGYVSNIAETGSVTLSLPEVHATAIPGVTITWSGEYDEYPRVFTVTAKNGDTVVAETTVTDNDSSQSIVELEISNYDSVTITVHNWCLPNRRARIDTVKLGQDITFTKEELLSYSHEQIGSVVSGELPKNSISFSIDNTDNRWNPSNPSGMERYLSERQRLTVRYGLNVGDTVEWVKAGTFYLSEWRAPSNGLEASFVARDMLEYMLNEPYTGITSGTISEIANAAVAQANLPAGSIVSFDFGAAGDYQVKPFEEGYSIAEVLQLCANAAGCGFWQDRDGVLWIKAISTSLGEYVIPSELAYSWPEIELSKNLKDVSVSWGDGNKYVLNVGVNGETQTVDNPLVASEEHAAYVAQMVRNRLQSRKTISGEYRADPILDVFDSVVVESKFGYVSPVVLTEVKYTFSGSFKGSYSGRVMSDANILGNFILGVSTLG